MRYYRIFFAIAFMTPFLILNLDGFIYTKEEVKRLDASINDTWLPGAVWVDCTNGKEYKTLDYGRNVWMTKNFEIEGELMGLEAAYNHAPEGWRIPTVDEWSTLLDHFGFGGNPNSLIPSAYFTFNFTSAGYVDPLIGKTSVGKIGLFLAMSENGEGHYIMISDRKLIYKEGTLYKGTMLAVRYVRK
ncbi:MAG: hypothetical protein ACI905_000311 [Roseivirga sp.]|jgi:uncharacterized protein (TIGR02145 family)